jgi:hypothetical protein
MGSNNPTQQFGINNCTPSQSPPVYNTANQCPSAHVSPSQGMAAYQNGNRQVHRSQNSYPDAMFSGSPSTPNSFHNFQYADALQVPGTTLSGMGNMSTQGSRFGLPSYRTTPAAQLLYQANDGTNTSKVCHKLHLLHLQFLCAAFQDQ